MRKYLKVKEVSEQLKVSPSTVRYYCNNGRLKYDLTPQGQRVFQQKYINEFLGLPENQEEIIVFYIRSSTGDNSLLKTQEKLLTEKYGIPTKVYSDKASGLNENRKGLQQLIKDAKEEKFNTVCITNKDRLTRFGYKYIKDHLQTLNITIKYIEDQQTKNLNEELLQDFMSLVASFSGKFYRLRGYKQQQELLNKAKENIEESIDEKESH